jgi:hypothetical protein
LEEQTTFPPSLVVATILWQSFSDPLQDSCRAARGKGRGTAEGTTAESVKVKSNDLVRCKNDIFVIECFFRVFRFFKKYLISEETQCQNGGDPTKKKKKRRMVRVKVTTQVTRPEMIELPQRSSELADGSSFIDGIPASGGGASDPPSGPQYVPLGLLPSMPLSVPPAPCIQEKFTFEGKEFILSILPILSDRAHYRDAIDQYGTKWRKCSYNCAATNTWKVLTVDYFYKKSDGFHSMCIDCFKEYDINRKRQHPPDVQRGAKRPKLDDTPDTEIIKFVGHDGKEVVLRLEPFTLRAKYRDAIDGEGRYWRRCGLKCSENNTWKLRDPNYFFKCDNNSTGFEGRCIQCVRAHNKQRKEEKEKAAQDPEDPDPDYMEDVADVQDQTGNGDYLENGVWMRPCRSKECKSHNIRKELNIDNFPAREINAANKGFDYRCRTCKAIAKKQRNRAKKMDAVVPVAPPMVPVAPAIAVEQKATEQKATEQKATEQKATEQKATEQKATEQKATGEDLIGVLKKIESRFAALEQQQKDSAQALNDEVQKLAVLKTTMNCVDQMVNKQKEMESTNKQIEEIRSQTMAMEKQLKEKLMTFK